MARLSVTVDGVDEMVAKLARINSEVRVGVRAALQQAAIDVRNHAFERIKNGPKTGQLYTFRFFTDPSGRVRPMPGVKRPPHRASAQGEYPAADTGALMNSLNWEMEPDFGDSAPDLNAAIDAAGKHAAVVYADAAHAKPLEYKPASMGGRPFLRRAAMERSEAVVGYFLALKDRFTPR